MIDTNVKLPQPEVGYGAVYGRDRTGQQKRHYVLTVFTSVWLVALATWVFGGNNTALTTEFLNFSGWGISIFVTVALGIVGLFGGIDSCLNYHDHVYEQDVYENRTHYARTVFREWFMERYGVKINSDQAHNLMDGLDARVRKGDEYLRVMFDYSGRNFSTLAMVGRRPNEEYVDSKNWNFPDTDSIEFNLTILEDPQQPRRYAWT